MISIKYRALPTICIIIILMSSQLFYDSIWNLYVSFILIFLENKILCVCARYIQNMKDISHGLTLLCLGIFMVSIGILFFGWPRYILFGYGSSTTTKVSTNPSSWNTRSSIKTWLTFFQWNLFNFFVTYLATLIFLCIYNLCILSQ